MASIDAEELIALQHSIDNGTSPKDALRVLSQYEYRGYEKGDSVNEIILPIRQRVFKDEPLPEDFLNRPNNLDVHTLSFITKFSSKIAILCRQLEKTEAIRDWVIATMAQHNGASEGIIASQLRFNGQRRGFGGPAIVNIIEDTRGIADQL